MSVHEPSAGSACHVDLVFTGAWILSLAFCVGFWIVVLA